MADLPEVMPDGGDHASYTIAVNAFFLNPA
ncbi:hypothetical protein J2792_003911 [Novosphingobium capsulatum]|uniref:Uncharacterized protein n=1 Tax=Novosphingobium capsulatum TaxID=13688 RepID=A0ABU1MRR1_9SPHN|nr:hypothetical protein [Novosphingobium capsulatum]